MKGFNESEVEMLINEAKKAKDNGESLTEVFNRIAKSTQRARGSVRNFYYSIMKSSPNQKTDSLVKESGLKVEKNVGFTKNEEEALVKGVLEGVKMGKSVRKAIIDMAGGDGKMELRIQNKYRNLVKTSPEVIERIAKEINLNKDLKIGKKSKDLTPYIKKVADEIDSLVDKLKSKYMEENENLIKENLLLKQRIDELSTRLGLSQVAEFFSQDKKAFK